MDSLINAAARWLAAGDPIAALRLVALRNDAAGLALRGMALAQLGEHTRARELLRAASRAFGSREPVARARCVLAEAEIALASRDVGWAARRLEAARGVLERHGDAVNAAHARQLRMRQLLLTGRLDELERELSADPGRRHLAPSLAAGHQLLVAQLALRRVRPKAARAAMQRAAHAARRAAVPALVAEAEAALVSLEAPAARQISRGREQLLAVGAIETLLASRALVVDSWRPAIRHVGTVVSLATRPVLMAIARVLAEAWPLDASREALIQRAFRIRFVDETHRARLRVEIGRLRRLLAPVAAVESTPGGFMLRPLQARSVVVLAPLVEDRHADILAVLSDGESWPASAVAAALGTSARSVQRALGALARAGKVQPVGRGRARRWITPLPLPGFATFLLLPPSLPTD